MRFQNSFFGLFLVVFSIGNWAQAELQNSVTPEESSDQTKKKIKYTKGKDVNFEELLIEGQMRRPEISVVTGNTDQGADGLLRLRENFTDRVAKDFGEEVK